ATSPGEKLRRCSIAWNTGQYASQYRHALQTVISWRDLRVALLMGPTSAMLALALGQRAGSNGEADDRAGRLQKPRRLDSSDLAEDRADRHPHAGHIALSEDVSGHDFAGREHVLGKPPLHDDARVVVHGDTEVREGDARSQRVGPERRRVETLRPVGFV